MFFPFGMLKDTKMVNEGTSSFISVLKLMLRRIQQSYLGSFSKEEVCSEVNKKKIKVIFSSK